MIQTLKLDRLQRLAANRRPTYMDEVLACGRVEGDVVHFDRDSDCYKKLMAAKEGPKPAVPRAIPSTGLGDTVAWVTSKLGIPTCAPCKKRQAKLNKMFPYRGE